jgi:hypothetical protein
MLYITPEKLVDEDGTSSVLWRMFTKDDIASNDSFLADAADFAVEDDEDNEAGSYDSFLMDAASQMLRHTMVSSKKNPEKPLLNWQYLSYTTLDKKDFPSKMQFSFTLSKTPVTATLTLNNPKKNTDWETRTEVNTNRFKEVSLTEVLSMIMKLSQ